MIQTTDEESSAVIQNHKICKVWVSRWRVKRFIDHSGSSETQGGRKEGREDGSYEVSHQTRKQTTQLCFVSA